MLRTLTATDRSVLIHLAATLPVGLAERRIILRRVAEAPVDEEEPSSGGGGPSALLLQFLDEVGDQKRTNPDTQNQVKIKTLSGKPKGSGGHDLFLKVFEAWIDQRKDDGAPKKAPKKAPEKAPKAPAKAPEKAPKAPKAEWVGHTEEALNSWGEDQNAKRDAWTSGQVDALKIYTGEAYQDINSSLRRDGEVDSNHEGTVGELDSLFESPEGRMQEPIKVRRGLEQAHPLVQLLKSGELEEGAYFEDPGYQSTSIKSDLKWGSYALEIDVPKGAKAVYAGPPPEDFSEYPEEYELLLNRGTRIEITKFDPKARIIEVRVVVA